MAQIARALMAVVVVGLGFIGIASAEEDRVDQALREARETQRQQEQRSANGPETWYKSPDGQRWLRTFDGRNGKDTSQESTYLYRSNVPHVVSTTEDASADAISPGATPESRLRWECIAITGGELLRITLGVQPRPNPVIKQMCDELHARCTLGDSDACQILRGK